MNFTDLAVWSERCGLEAEPLRTQRDFLLEFLPGAETRAARDPALAYLLADEGAGSAFKVLESGRGRV